LTVRVAWLRNPRHLPFCRRGHVAPAADGRDISTAKKNLAMPPP